MKTLNGLTDGTPDERVRGTVVDEQQSIDEDRTLFGSLAEHIDSDAIDEAVNRCLGKVQ